MDAKRDPKQTIDEWLERDLSQAAAEGLLPPAFEVDDVLDQIVEYIAAGRNPILTGESGVGKTAAIYELVRRVRAGTVLPQLRDKRFVQFSIQVRAAALKQSYHVVQEMQKLIEALVRSGDEIVPFFRDIDLAYQFGLESQLQVLTYRISAPILGEGNRATAEAMFEHLESLQQVYSVVDVEEPKLARTARILEQWAAEQAQRREPPAVEYTPEALEHALHLTHRFLARSRLPRKALDLLGQLAPVAAQRRPVTGADVIERFCRHHRTPRVLVDPAEPLDLGELERTFESRVLGQREAVRAMVNMIGLIKSGLSDMRRPFGVFLFVGPTGVGKTHVAQLLAEYLFGSRDRMIRFNMADYQQESDAGVLFGNPEGTTMAARRGLITQRLMGHAFGVLLLDELEKAQARTHDRFLQMVDEGAFINGAGEMISCRSTIIIATSNAGAQIYRGQAFGFAGRGGIEEKDRQLDGVLEKHFRFEFLNRFDQVVHFHPLSREDIRTIALRELEDLQHRTGLKQRKLALEIDESVLDWLAVQGYDPCYGARFLRRAIERHVATTLADLIVRRNPSPSSTLTLTVRQNRIVARLADAETASGARRVEKESVALAVGTGAEERILDRESLLSEVERLRQVAAPLLTELEQQRDQRSDLLTRMNEPDFWSRGPERNEVLDQFRALDVAIRAGGRLAKPLLRLEDVEEEPLNRLARAVEAASRALRDWQTRRAEEGEHAVWLLISGGDPLHPAGEWLTTLAEMELAWCRKLHLTAAVVAYELLDGELGRVALDVEGPGSAVYLEMEAGVHRWCRAQGADLKARIEVVPKAPSSAVVRENLQTARRIRPLFNLEPDCRGRIELEQRGVTVELLGAHHPTLSHLLDDLERHWRSESIGQLPVARIYGEAGTGARDPRTEVMLPRLRDVQRGKLDKFLDAWQARTE